MAALYENMKYQTHNQFEHLNFHDSIVSGISKNETEIIIDLEFANILAEHSENPYSTAKNIEPCKLVFLNVKEVVANLYIENRENLHVHPTPDKPLTEEIVEAKETTINGGLKEYTLGGMCDHGWSDWIIRCSGFKLLWQEFNGDSWFVDWPPEKNV